MIEARELFSSLTEKDLEIHVELADDAKYAMKGERTILFQLESSGSLEAHDVLYVPRLKKKLLSVSIMKNKGFVVIFRKAKELTHSKRASPNIKVSIGVREGNLYRSRAKLVQPLVHDNDNLCELWQKRMEHLLYNTLSTLREIVIGLAYFKVDQPGVCVQRVCALGKNAKAKQQE